MTIVKSAAMNTGRQLTLCGIDFILGGCIFFFFSNFYIASQDGYTSKNSLSLPLFNHQENLKQTR